MKESLPRQILSISKDCCTISETLNNQFQNYQQNHHTIKQKYILMMKNQKDSLLKFIEELKETHNKLETDRESNYKIEMEKLNDENRAEKTENNENQGKIQKLEEEIKRNKEEMQKDKVNIEEKRIHIGKTERTLEENKKKIEKGEESEREYRERINEQTNEIDRLRKSVREGERKLDEIEKSRDSQSTHNQKLRIKIEELNELIQIQKRQVEETNNAMREKLNQKEIQISNLREEIEIKNKREIEKEEYIQGLIHQQSILQNDSDKLRHTISQNIIEIQKFNKRVEDMDDLVERAINERAVAVQKEKEAQIIILQINKRLGNLQEKNIQLENNGREKDTKIENFDLEIKGKLDEIDTYKGKIDEMVKRMEE